MKQGLFGPNGPIIFTVSPYTTVEKGPVWKNLMAEINCIPPQLNLWYRVVCIGGIGGIVVLLIVFSRWHK
jgi:hypothetical protein